MPAEAVTCVQGVCIVPKRKYFACLIITVGIVVVKKSLLWILPNLRCAYVNEQHRLFTLSQYSNIFAWSQQWNKMTPILKRWNILPGKIPRSMVYARTEAKCSDNCNLVLQIIEGLYWTTVLQWSKNFFWVIDCPPCAVLKFEASKLVQPKLGQPDRLLQPCYTGCQLIWCSACPVLAQTLGRGSCCMQKLQL